MSAGMEWVVTCDGCGSSPPELPLDPGSNRRARSMMMRQRGWHEVVIDGGKPLHFCPSCWSSGDGGLWAKVVAPQPSAPFLAAKKAKENRRRPPSPNESYALRSGSSS